MKEYQFVHYTNIPGNKPTSYTNGNANTQPAKQNQCTDSFTESSSSTLDNNIICIGEKRESKTSDFALVPKVQKVNALSIPSHTNVKTKQLTHSLTQGLHLLPLPKPMVPETLTNYRLSQDKNTISVTSPARNGTIIKVTLTSPKKLPSDQRSIKEYCQKEANQINENVTNSKKIIDKPCVDATYDGAFKYLFSNVELAKDFIQSVLGVNIISIEELNTHLLESKQGKQYIENQASLAVDVFFEIETDQLMEKNQPQNSKMLVFLEMQRKNFPGFLVREQIYTAVIATNAVTKGISKIYDKIPKVVGIIIALESVLSKEVPYCSQISTTVQSTNWRCH
jgi:hypothetical protein